MNALINNISAQRSKEMRDYASSRRRAARARRREQRSAGSAELLDQVAIRPLNDADRDELVRVAGRDSSATPTGDVLGAIADGRLVAAVSLTTGELVADPFIPSGDVRDELARRATKLQRMSAHRGHGFRRHGFHVTARPRRS